MWELGGSAWAPLLALVPLVVWTRVRLERHTPAQAFAGALAGSLVLAAMIALLP